MGKDKSAAVAQQEFFRWPPVGVSVSGGAARSKLLEEKESLPLPFLSRELRVDQAEWLAYLRQQPRFRRQKALGNRSLSGIPEKDVEASIQPSGQHPHRFSCGLPIHPISRLALAWRVLVTFVDATYSAFLIPISCAFHWNVRYFSWYNGIDAAAGVVFWLDIFMGFTTGFVAVYNLKRLIVMDWMQIAHFYVCRGTFVYDLLAALPIIAEVVVLCTPRTVGSTALHVIFLLRLARMIRVFKMVEWLIKISLAGQINKIITRFLSAGHMFLVSLLYAGLVLLNLLTCFWYYIASWEGLENSWLTSVGPTDENLSGSDPVRQYIASFHFIVATVTTTGYGDISAVTAAEQVAAIVIMLFGVILFGFIISGSQELVQYLAPEARTLGLLRHKMEQVEIWAAKRKISPKLLARCNSYFTEVWLHNAELQESRIFSELPAVLQAHVCYELTQELFGHSSIFNVLDTKSRLLVASRLTPLSVAAGHDICREGEPAESLWILEEGEVLAIRHGAELELLMAPAILGEGSILANLVHACRKQPYIFRAVTPCMLWSLNRGDMDHVFRMHPELMDSILASFKDHLSRIISQNSHLFDDEGWETVLEHVEHADALMTSDGVADGAMLATPLMESKTD